MLAMPVAAAPPGTMPQPRLQLYLMVVPPLTLDDAQQKGYAGDLVLEAARRAGYAVDLVVVPSARAMATLQDSASRDTLIIPLARQPDREELYSWIAPIATVNRAFFSLDHKIQSFDEARASLRVIAVARGTAGVNILRRQGFSDSQLYEVADNSNAAQMLMLRRVDAWYGPVQQFQSWAASVDPRHAVRMGALLGTTDNYLACSRVCDVKMMARMAGAIATLQRDGTARVITARYLRGDQAVSRAGPLP